MRARLRQATSQPQATAGGLRRQRGTCRKKPKRSTGQAKRQEPRPSPRLPKGTSERRGSEGAKGGCRRPAAPRRSRGASLPQESGVPGGLPQGEGDSVRVRPRRGCKASTRTTNPARSATDATEQTSATRPKAKRSGSGRPDSPRNTGDSREACPCEQGSGRRRASRRPPQGACGASEEHAGKSRSEAQGRRSGRSPGRARGCRRAQANDAAVKARRAAAAGLPPRGGAEALHCRKRAVCPEACRRAKATACECAPEGGAKRARAQQTRRAAPQTQRNRPPRPGRKRSGAGAEGRRNRKSEPPRSLTASEGLSGEKRTSHSRPARRAGERSGAGPTGRTAATARSSPESQSELQVRRSSGSDREAAVDRSLPRPMESASPPARPGGRHAKHDGPRGNRAARQDGSTAEGTGAGRAQRSGRQLSAKRSPAAMTGTKLPGHREAERTKAGGRSCSLEGRAGPTDKRCRKGQTTAVPAPSPAELARHNAPGGQTAGRSRTGENLRAQKAPLLPHYQSSLTRPSGSAEAGESSS